MSISTCYKCIFHVCSDTLHMRLLYSYILHMYMLCIF